MQMSKTTRGADKRERKQFEEWAKAHIKKNPQDWVLLAGHDGEEHWAWLAWQARGALSTAPVTAQN